MAFPDDLDNVTALKIHPAIGVARLANNDDYYEFFDYEEKRKLGQAQDLKYMSEQNGSRWIMRQAVQFKLFAYGDDGKELGELSKEIIEQIGLQVTWSASVANRKLNNWSGGSTPVVEANASAARGETSRLEGNNPWRPDGKVWLGDITGDGLFIPPKGGVYRETENSSILPFGNHERDHGVLDTTSDGAINVTLEDTDIPVMPACVIVAPQQHSPDVNPGDVDNGRNKDFVRETRELLKIPEDATLVGMGYEIDIAMMRTINAEYKPGIEVSLKITNALPNPSTAFYPRGQQNINENEIRPSYGEGFADYGALTAGLCSTWQTDLNACLDFWTAEFPNVLQYGDAPEERNLSRKDFLTPEGTRMEHPEDLNAYIDMMGVARDLEDDPFFVFGTERGRDDNAGETPEAPFPLDPPQ